MSSECGIMCPVGGPACPMGVDHHVQWVRQRVQCVGQCVQWVCQYVYAPHFGRHYVHREGSVEERNSLL
uniref:Uncharacterized protein n=1 Tax=Timema shepardi TaxID=629360 RepID=A0A7R9AQU5_TIMSH|nr:unnamed protein product [Timema shepardi]